MQDQYQIITNKIIEQLEAAEKSSWVKPWSFLCDEHFNLVSKQPYRGINRMSLSVDAGKKEFNSNVWLTFKQATNLGYSIKKGEKASDVCFFKPMLVTDKDAPVSEDGEVATKAIRIIRGYKVFNVEQLENYDGVLRLGGEKGVYHDFSPIEIAESILAESGAVINYVLGPRAFYSPSSDHIVLPKPEQFAQSEMFYGVAMHELTHWTGHESRLNRNIKNSFGTQDYAFEELVAEIGASFVCAHIGIETHTMKSHVSYLDHWLKVLKEDKRAIFKAAALAQKASDLILGVRYAYQEDETMQEPIVVSESSVTVAE